MAPTAVSLWATNYRAVRPGQALDGTRICAHPTDDCRGRASHLADLVPSLKESSKQLSASNTTTARAVPRRNLVGEVQVHSTGLQTPVLAGSIDPSCCQTPLEVILLT